MNNSKQAILIIGLSSRDVRALARQTLAKCEASDKRWELILEDDVVSHYVNLNEMHPLCCSSWNAPIKNECIIELLTRTEKAFENPYVDGIIVGGSFAIDEAVRNIYVDILKEQGFTIESRIVNSSWLSLVCDSREFDTYPLPKLVEMWDQYNQSFVRQYTPVPDTPNAVIISKAYDYRNEAINVMIKGLLEANFTVISLEDLYSGHSTRQPEHITKIDTFWRKVANHYNVHLVYETDADTCHCWRTIGVPCISLTNPFSLKYSD